MRIFNRLCGLPVTKETIKEAFLRLKPSKSGRFRRKRPRFPFAESARLIKNQHGYLRIRKHRSKSAQPAENPHDLLKIRTALPKSTRHAENPHDTSRIHTAHQKSAQRRKNPHARIQSCMTKRADIPRATHADGSPRLMELALPHTECRSRPCRSPRLMELA